MGEWALVGALLGGLPEGVAAGGRIVAGLLGALGWAAAAGRWISLEGAFLDRLLVLREWSAWSLCLVPSLGRSGSIGGWTPSRKDPTARPTALMLH